MGVKAESTSTLAVMGKKDKRDKRDRWVTMAVARGGSMQRVQAWYAAVCGRLELLLGQLGAGGTSPRGVGRWRDG